MVKEKRRLFSGKDVLIAVAAIGAAVALYFVNAGEKAGTAVIERDGEILYRVNFSTLSQPVTYKIDGEYPAEVIAEPNGIYFASASCPDQSCVHMGKLRKTGEIAVCLPARLVIRIEGENKSSSTDAMTG